VRIQNKSALNVIAWAQRHPTVEVTGIIASSGRVIPMSNISKTPGTHYAWDAAEMKRVFAEMDTKDEEPSAFYHSHPNGRPDPSEVDMQGAMNPGMVYVIAYLHVNHWHLSAWLCLEPGVLVGEPLDYVP
jgi:proteasome lid subunit RPN8/RPN11